MDTWNRAPSKMFLLLAATLASSALAEEPPSSFDHDSQHCHDVSIWGEVDFRDEECNKCETRFEQECDEKFETVCEQVPSTTCQLVAYKDCRMYVEEAQYQETEVVTDGQYVPWECTNFTKLEIHNKLVPRCVNVTRQDCVTKWVVTGGGEKVWAGNEDCKPVTWLNCTLVAEPKPINQTYTRCVRSGVPIPTMICELRDRTRMVTGMRCEVRSAVNCNCTHSEQCVDIVYEECREVARPISCRPTSLRVPFQPRIHRVKCLLPDDDASPDLDVQDSADQADAFFDLGELGGGRRAD